MEHILDQVAEALAAAAAEYGFGRRAPEPIDSVAPLLSVRLLGLKADRDEAAIGDELTLRYAVACQDSTAARVWLSASLVDARNNEFSDMSGDRQVLIRPGLHTYSRPFRIGRQFQTGKYRLVGGLWYGESIISADAVRFQATDQAGVISVQSDGLPASRQPQ